MTDEERGNMKVPDNFTFKRVPIVWVDQLESAPYGIDFWIAPKADEPMIIGPLTGQKKAAGQSFVEPIRDGGAAGSFQGIDDGF